jgi:hypothetical protein
VTYDYYAIMIDNVFSSCQLSYVDVKFKSEEKMWLLFQHTQKKKILSYVYLSCKSFKASKLAFIVMCLRMTERQITEVSIITLGPR